MNKGKSEPAFKFEWSGKRKSLICSMSIVNSMMFLQLLFLSCLSWGGVRLIVHSPLKLRESITKHELLTSNRCICGKYVYISPNVKLFIDWKAEVLKSKRYIWIFDKLHEHETVFIEIWGIETKTWLFSSVYDVGINDSIEWKILVFPNSHF